MGYVPSFQHALKMYEAAHFPVRSHSFIRSMVAGTCAVAALVCISVVVFVIIRPSHHTTTGATIERTDGQTATISYFAKGVELHQDVSTRKHAGEQISVSYLNSDPSVVHHARMPRPVFVAIFTTVAIAMVIFIFRVLKS